ncbi:MAG: hypothetical protein AB1498_07220 [bacterium]
MKPEYPIFILTKDEMSIAMLVNSKELNFYEQIDIEEGLYEGWDVRGYPIILSWDKKYGTKIEITKEITQLEKLEEAIINYAKLYNPKVPFKYSGPENNITELFNEVEKHIKKDTFREKLKHLFKRS